MSEESKRAELLLVQAAEALRQAGLGYTRVSWCSIGNEPRTGYDALLGLGAQARATLYEHPDRAPYVIESCEITLHGVHFEAQFSRPPEAGELGGKVQSEHRDTFTCREVAR